MEVYGLLASGYGDWPIIKQIAWLLGKLMNGIYNVMNAIGIQNIGICIIIFTVIIYTLMIPLTIKQQKWSKMSAVMQPDIRNVYAMSESIADGVVVRGYAVQKKMSVTGSVVSRAEK